MNEKTINTGNILTRIGVFIIGIPLAYFILSVSPVQATVGGPTYIYNIRSNTDSDSGREIGVMYEEQNIGGKGCPPEIYALDTKTGKRNVLVSCDEGIGNDTSSYQTKFAITLAKYPILLNRINLKYNSIRAKATVIREIGGDYENNVSPKTDFSLDIFQNNEKKATLAYSGCKPEQPHIIEGYTIPVNNFIALLVSTIGDCFETGYVREQLYIVPGITPHYPTALKIREKNTPAVVDAGSENGSLLVVAEKPSVIPIKPDEVTPPVLPQETVPSNLNLPELVYQIIIGSLILVIIVLFVFKLKMISKSVNN